MSPLHLGLHQLSRSGIEHEHDAAVIQPGKSRASRDEGLDADNKRLAYGRSNFSLADSATSACHRSSLRFDATTFLSTSALATAISCPWPATRLPSEAGEAPWCSGLTCHPVKVEIGGSNPLGVAITRYFT